MGNVDLNGKPEEVKTKLLYLNIPTALLFIYDCWEYPKANKFAKVMVATIVKSLTNKELTQEILRLGEADSVQKLSYNKPEVYELFTKVFGPIWEEDING